MSVITEENDKNKNIRTGGICFVMVSLAGGGAERVISVTANHMASMGIPTAVLMTAGEDIAYDLDSRVETFSAGGVSGGSLSARLKRIRNMRRFFRAHRGMSVISFGPGTSFFAWISLIGLHMRFIVSERNDPAACPHPKLRNFVYRRACRLICQTPDALASFPADLRKKGCVVPNPVRSDLPEPVLYTDALEQAVKAGAGGNPGYEAECTHRPHTIAAVGRLQAQKNYPLLLEAFALFHKKYPDYTLHVYGKGELLPKLRESCAKLGLADRDAQADAAPDTAAVQPSVVWEGFRRDVPELIRHAGMYVLSSDYEGISNALLEAMALGLPVISTDCPIGGSRMCIEDGKNGLLVPCGDAEALAGAMCRLAEDEAFASGLGRQAAKVRETYAEGTVTESWLKAAENGNMP